MPCQSCGLESPTQDVTLHQNIGLLVMRRSRQSGGGRCDFRLGCDCCPGLVDGAALSYVGL